MSSRLEERFEEIANEALRRAELIPCSILEFADGLTVMIVTLEDARTAAQECHEATEQRKEDDGEQRRRER